METKELLAILREERQLLIEKIKWGTYMAITIVVPTLILILDLVLKREASIFSIAGTLAQLTIVVILLIIIVLGPLVFVIMNYWKYQDIEKTAEKIWGKEIAEYKNKSESQNSKKPS